MKKIGITFMAFILALGALAQNVEKITVTGNRVSLRAAPDLNAVLLDRAMAGDQLLLADNSNPEWVGVHPPRHVTLWVRGEYILDGIVEPALLNVRSGPSAGHNVVGVVSRGKELTVRGKLDGWVRIAPPEEAVVWISRAYTAFPSSQPSKSAATNEPVVMAVNPEPADVVKESAIVITVEPSIPELAKVVEPKQEPAVAKETEPIVKTVFQPAVNDAMIAAGGISELPRVLKPDPEKEQAAAGAFAGTLQPVNAVLYKLIDPAFENIVLCYVRGNRVQMEAFSGRSLLLTGKTYWAAGVNEPLLVPEKIEVFQNP